MKLYLFIVLALCVGGASTKLYDINITQLNGAKTSMANYARKKILIAPVSSSKPDIPWLMLLENLGRFNDSLAVIVAPDIDGDSSDNLKVFQGLRHRIPDIIILRPGYLRKEAGSRQTELFDWLTDKNKNGHFDLEVQPVRQLFLINGKGNLYGVLSGEINVEDMKKVIHESVN